MSKIITSVTCLFFCCDILADGMDEESDTHVRSCNLSPVIVKSDVLLPDFVGEGQTLSGAVRSKFTFNEVHEDGKDGILINENILMAYYDSLQQKYSSKINQALTAKMKQSETCELSIVGVKTEPNNSAPLSINGVAEFKVRKCVGFDYPCGETCEVRWDYQACRTEYCRATQVTNLFDGMARFESSVALSKKSKTEVQAQISNVVLDQDISRGDLAGILNRLGVSNSSLDSLFGASPPDLAGASENYSIVKRIPQEAFIYKPELVDAKWELVKASEIQGAQSYGIMIQRKQLVERTVACNWISCLRAGPSEACEL